MFFFTFRALKKLNFSADKKCEAFLTLSGLLILDKKHKLYANKVKASAYVSIVGSSVYNERISH